MQAWYKIRCDFFITNDRLLLLIKVNPAFTDWNSLNIWSSFLQKFFPIARMGQRKTWYAAIGKGELSLSSLMTSKYGRAGFTCKSNFSIVWVEIEFKKEHEMKFILNHDQHRDKAKPTKRISAPSDSSSRISVRASL